MPKWVVLEKQVGETPLQVQERWRAEQGIANDVPLAYAGRLDPMASGKLLILVGNECKQQERYFDLDKEYEFEILFDFKSDSGDVLGLADRAPSRTCVSIIVLRDLVRKLVGVVELPYPVFSSKPVQGKPLFVWKLENRLDEIEIPTKQSEIFKLEVISERTVSSYELREHIFKKINSIPVVDEQSKKLGSDFRRGDIRKRWNTLFQADHSGDYHIVKFRCIASSGTYMRTLAEYIAKCAQAYGLALSIHRTEIGKYRKIGPFGFWYKRF